MQALKFTLSGDFAHFKISSLNKVCDFTYQQLSPVALKGILGAILGLKGYGNDRTSDYPEWYEKLKDCQISIVPLNEKGHIPTCKISYNNTTGICKYSNFLGHMQLLVNPKWDIYIHLDSLLPEIKDKLVDYILHKKTVYVPYLGCSEFLAHIQDGQLVTLDEVSLSDVSTLSCLFKKEQADCQPLPEMDYSCYKFESELPCAMDAKWNQHICERYVYTNYPVSVLTGHVYLEHGQTETTDRYLLFS